MDLFLVLPPSFFQCFCCIHLIPAFSITMFILQKTRHWPFKVLKKTVVMTLKVHSVVLSMVYRHISGRIWAFFYHQMAPNPRCSFSLLAEIHQFSQVLPVFMHKQSSGILSCLYKLCCSRREWQHSTQLFWWLHLGYSINSYNILGDAVSNKKNPLLWNFEGDVHVAPQRIKLVTALERVKKFAGGAHSNALHYISWEIFLLCKHSSRNMSYSVP